MYEQMVRGQREGPIGRRIVIVAAVSVVVVVLITALAVALAPPRPPGSVLTGTSWQWTGSTTGTAEGPLGVSDPAAYTIELLPDRTFRARADCNVVSGTYRTVPSGRTGSPWARLTLRPGPSSLAACGADSLSDVFVRQLESAVRYVVADAVLTVGLADGGSMTFGASDPSVPVAP